MKASLNWLAELLPDAKLETKNIADLAYELDMTGTAVEAITKTDDSFEGVVLGQIVGKERHPESDHLWVTKVEVGQDEPLQIVCGAQNFDLNDKVVVATVGSVLPGDFAIKKAKLRGIVSMGMNCSARELGLGQEHDGILILPEDAPVGQSFSAYRKESDTIIEFEITPNRADCLSMVGLAREIGAVLKSEPIPTRPIELIEDCSHSITDYLDIEIAEDAETPRYMGRLIQNIKVGPSPKWLADKVESAGARSINNIVDATNYILFEMGQPLHAFDFDKLVKDDKGIAHIKVRKAQEGEVITTLDEVERKLDNRDTLICDDRGGICIAGVMGGMNTEVDEDTHNIFLEAAVFSHASISRTSRRLALISEASLRFERQVNRVLTPEVLDRAAALIAELGGGTVAQGLLDVYTEPFEQVSIGFSFGRMDALIGYQIDRQEVLDIFKRLGFEAIQEDSDSLIVTVPSYRPDVQREVDLIEEVLRLYGMERIPSELLRGVTAVAGLTKVQKLRNKAGRVVRALGLNEAMSYPYLDEEDLAKVNFELKEGRELVRLHNPMSIDQGVLRPTLLPPLLNKVSLNLSRGVKDVHLYEMGLTFETAQGRKLPFETERIAGVLTGSWRAEQWNDPRVPIDFFDAKGIVEELAENFRIPKLGFKAADLPHIQPGRGAHISFAKEIVGWVGEIHPEVLERFEIDAPVVAFEINLEKVFSAAQDLKNLEAPHKFPGIELDVALIVDREVQAEELTQRIMSFGRKAKLESVHLFDVYTGKGVDAGKKSLAFKLVYRAADRTLQTEEIEKAHEKILSRLENDFGATLRG